MVVALAVAGAVVLVAVVVLALTVGRGGGDGGGTSGTTTGGDTMPAATLSPDGLGNDLVLDDLADACYSGDMGACDSLFWEADLGSAYETYGATCAGRQAAGTGRDCTEAFPD